MSLLLRFEPAALELAIAPGEHVIDAAEGVPSVGLPLACRAASCGVCRVVVEAGADLFESADPTERLVLGALRATSDERLGCQLRVRVDALHGRAARAMPALRLRVLTPALPPAAPRSGSAG